MCKMGPCLLYCRKTRWLPVRLQTNTILQNMSLLPRQLKLTWGMSNLSGIINHVIRNLDTLRDSSRCNAWQHIDVWLPVEHRKRMWDMIKDSEMNIEQKHAEEQHLFGTPLELVWNLFRRSDNSLMGWVMKNCHNWRAGCSRAGAQGCVCCTSTLNGLL